MDDDRRESLRRALRTLAESHAATLRLMEQTYGLLTEELALDPFDYFARYDSPIPTLPRPHDSNPIVDEARLLVTFCGRTCFLGNTLPFRLLARLARQPGCYVTHDDLMDEVWDGAHRSESVVRSVVKVLRQKLRLDGLDGLADAIDGSVPGRYALKLSQIVG
jgi:Transcriptional regulatory protein, C terminal